VPQVRATGAYLGLESWAKPFLVFAYDENSFHEGAKSFSPTPAKTQNPPQNQKLLIRNSLEIHYMRSGLH
jgi:hypothetical protein